MHFSIGLTQVGQKYGDVMANKEIKVYLRAAVMCSEGLASNFICKVFMFALELYKEFPETFRPKVCPT